MNQAPSQKARPDASPRVYDVASEPVATGAQRSQGSRLSAQERLDLEALVLRQLTPQLLMTLQGRLGLTLEKRPKREVPFGWMTLVMQCERDGLLADLSAVLRFTFPELASHPLLVKFKNA